VRIVDQTLLPESYRERDLTTIDEVADAISRLAVRGAPAIGVAAAMGLAVGLRGCHALAAADFRARAREAAALLRRTRPTAVNLAWALDRMLVVLASAPDDTGVILDALADEATRLLDDDRAMCQRIGEHGLALVPSGARVLTHCNAGALATCGVGTALAPLYLAAAEGRRLEVLVGETRPLLQGSRLTAWELSRAGIPVRVAADAAIASQMAAGKIDLVIVGADRIAANGDVANKVGTYSLAVLAAYHRIPFYVAAPSSTVDPSIASGAQVPIEQRGHEEIARRFGRVTVPDGVPVENPAFDVTPAALIAAIITDRGVHRPPFAFTSI
jgi:methylthioribose-1-phosphate isomerase